jgi:hypothetical protein
MRNEIVRPPLELEGKWPAVGDARRVVIEARSGENAVLLAPEGDDRHFLVTPQVAKHKKEAGLLS